MSRAWESVVVGMGSHLPERVVTNDELAPRLGVTAEWIQSRSGIEARRWVDPQTSTSDLALPAALMALEDAGIGPRDVDLIVFATLSPDHQFPGSAFFLQARLGARKVPVYDVRAQCSGFLYALSLADKFVQSGEVEHALVIGAEIHSKAMDVSPSGKHVAMLFGDGAGAFVLRRSAVSGGGPRGVGAVELHADGTFAKALWVPAPGMALGTDHWLEAAMFEGGLQYPQMDGPTVFMAAVARMTEVIQSVLAREGLTTDQIGLFVLHQANLRIVERVAQQLGVGLERFHNTIGWTANTTAASLPIGCHDARASGRIPPGTTVLLASFGAGFTWGAALVRF